jgi:hypothetical protein
MQVYTVHIDPLSAEPDSGAVLVREGFSWPAALFGVFWALYHGLWDWALALLAAGLAIGGLAALGGLDEVGQAVVQLGTMALAGALSNDWRRWALSRRGYRLAEVVAGDDLAAAERRYFERAPAALA